MSARTTPRAPRMVGLADLLNHGFIHDTQVTRSGHVPEDVRLTAERAYADFQERRGRPSTAPRPRQTVQIRRPVPRTPTDAPTVRTQRPNTSHVHRIRVRASIDISERERVVSKLTIDACCICMQRQRDHAFAPCFHMCVCKTCGASLTRCPVCRKDVTHIQRIYV